MTFNYFFKFININSGLHFNLSYFYRNYIISIYNLNSLSIFNYIKSVIKVFNMFKYIKLYIAGAVTFL